MSTEDGAPRIVEAGDRYGLGVVYDRSGSLLLHPHEEVLRSVENWDMDVMSPWRRFLPKTVFPGFHGRASSKLYVTSTRIVLVREIDEWRELAGELTPLGLPNAAAKEKLLATLRRAGVRQYCQVLPHALVIVSCKRYVKHGSSLDLKLMGDDNQQYAIMFWKTDGRDDVTLDFLSSRFRQEGAVSRAPP